MKHIVKFSGGKDSTAMLLLMLERSLPVDEIIFCDTGLEYPELYQHIAEVERYIGRQITVLHPPHSFEYFLADIKIIKGKHAGEHGYGWPRRKDQRWCTGRLKEKLQRITKKIWGIINYTLVLRQMSQHDIIVKVQKISSIPYLHGVLQKKWHWTTVSARALPLAGYMISLNASAAGAAHFKVKKHCKF